jgi:outer membrane protein TolC
MKIHIRLIVSFLLISAIAIAQNSSNWMDTLIEQTSSYLGAKSSLEDAREKVSRLKTDTLATVLDLKSAESDLAIAEANLVSARLNSRKTLLQNYFALFEASNTLKVAQLVNTLSQGNLRVNQARFKGGAINAIDLAKSEGEARDAQQDLDDAETASENAQANFKQRYGALPDPKVPLEATPKPQRTQLEAALTKHPQILTATASLERAKIDLGLKDNEFTAPLEIDAAKNMVSSAQRNFSEAQQTVKTAFKLAWDATTSSSNSNLARGKALAIAQNEYVGQKARFDKGQISRLVLLQSQITLEKNQAAVNLGQHRYVVAVVDLAIAANVDLWK